MLQQSDMELTRWQLTASPIRPDKFDEELYGPTREKSTIPCYRYGFYVAYEQILNCFAKRSLALSRGRSGMNLGQVLEWTDVQLRNEILNAMMRELCNFLGDACGMKPLIRHVYDDNAPDGTALIYALYSNDTMKGARNIIRDRLRTDEKAMLENIRNYLFADSIEPMWYRDIWDNEDDGMPQQNMYVLHSLTIQAVVRAHDRTRHSAIYAVFLGPRHQRQRVREVR